MATWHWLHRKYLLVDQFPDGLFVYKFEKYKISHKCLVLILQYKLDQWPHHPFERRNVKEIRDRNVVKALFCSYFKLEEEISTHSGPCSVSFQSIRPSSEML